MHQNIPDVFRSVMKTEAGRKWTDREKNEGEREMNAEKKKGQKRAHLMK